VASDFLELAATASLDTSDTSASRDKLKANALLMQKTSATKVPLEAVERRTGSGEETLPEPKNSLLLSATVRIAVK
jgi:hypothetical protein